MSDKSKAEMKRLLLAERYNEIVEAIAEADRPLYLPEIINITGMNIGQIKAANKYGRRAFGEGKIPIRDYVLSGPYGLFLPRRGRDIVAFVVYNWKKISSEFTTLKPILEYAMEKYGEELIDEMTKKSDSDQIQDEVIPWEIFNQIIETEYKGGTKQ